MLNTINSNYLKFFLSSLTDAQVPKFLEYVGEQGNHGLDFVKMVKSWAQVDTYKKTERVNVLDASGRMVGYVVTVENLTASPGLKNTYTHDF